MFQHLLSIHRGYILADIDIYSILLNRSSRWRSIEQTILAVLHSARKISTEQTKTLYTQQNVSYIYTIAKLLLACRNGYFIHPKQVCAHLLRHQFVPCPVCKVIHGIHHQSLPLHLIWNQQQHRRLVHLVARL